MKAQVSIEYIVFIGIILFIFSLASYSAVISGKGISDENEIIEARNIASILGYEINIASEIGDGYSHKFYLPASIFGQNYSINIENYFVIIEWKNKSYALPIAAQSISNIPKAGENTIRNIKGVIYFD